jgi:nicotinate phosphoribosyltransferase
MAHEYMQAFQGFGIRLRDFQKASLEAWVQEFRGNLGTALTDVIGIDAFLDDFDLYFAKLFDGLRHDSGDPFEWGEKVIAHYKHLRIDPRTKRLVFSDGLDLYRAIEIYRYFKGRIQVVFGIGTNLTNDTQIPPLNIVIKMTDCNGQPVAKITDSPGKTTGMDETFMAYLRQVFNKPNVCK